MTTSKDNKEMLIRYLENPNVHKFKLINFDLDDFKYDKNEVYKRYFQVIDKLEYAFYTETYPYPAFLIYNETSLLAFTIERDLIIDLLENLISDLDFIIENEVYSEVIRIKEMLKLYYQGSIKV